jgi:hypothetical protein
MTTRHRHRPAPSPGRSGLLLAALLLLGAMLGLAGCSTARQRDTPEGPLSLLHYRDPATARFFEAVYRSGNLYVDFRPELVVDAIVQDRTYRRLYVDMLRQQFLLPEAEVARLAAKQEREFDTQISVLLFTYEGTRTPSQLTKPDAPWKVFLRDDDGQLHVPASIARVREDSSDYQYIDKYFRGLDRWSRVYRLEFPKLSKAQLGVPVGSAPMELIITGVRGTVTLKWEDPRIFYAGKDAPG